MQPRRIQLLISAAETSSDAHGAQLLRAIRAQLPAEVELKAFGIGGPHLEREGLEIVVDARSLLVMGFLEILGHLPRIFSALRKISHQARLRKPDLAIVLDYPDFHFRLAKKLKAYGVPVIYYIPPKVWVWRTGRVRILARRFKKLLCIFPFEKEFYASHQIAVNYVGNPLCDELPLSLSKLEARKKLGLDAGERVLLVMPGSRRAELKNLFEVVMDASDQVAQKLASGPLKVLLPVPETTDLASVQERLRLWQKAHPQTLLRVRLSQGDSAIAMVAADVGMVKSGTSTLEAGLLGCPHVLFYKSNALSHFIFFKLIRYRGPVGLVNLVWGKGPETQKPYLITELLADEVTAERLAREALDLFQNSSRSIQVQQGLQQLREKMLGSLRGKSPSQSAARAVLEELNL